VDGSLACWSDERLDWMGRCDTTSGGKKMSIFVLEMISKLSGKQAGSEQLHFRVEVRLYPVFKHAKLLKMLQSEKDQNSTCMIGL